ncbi:MAG: ATP-dependent DNA helicase [Clostridia bacterium]|nr:ATP-dependent DNA helicase [Deltaproteobacteria bacterium]
MHGGQVGDFFRAGGPLSRTVDSYELRPEQITVAERIDAHLQVGGRLLIEAGTGTGKTLAYLAPLLASGRRSVISTGTKTLQDQLFNKDVPLLEKALGRTIDARLMKGRSNYLCIERAGETAKSPPLPGTEERTLFDTIIAWQGDTIDGDRAGLAVLTDDNVMWRDLSATSEQCRGRNCPHFERCFVTQARRLAQTAELVIVNHHLYFADLALRARGFDQSVALLPEHDIVVFDEAHELDEVAAQHFGVNISERRIQELAHDVARAVKTEPSLVARFGKTMQRLDSSTNDLFDALPFDHARGRVLIEPTARGNVRDRVMRVDSLLEEIENELTASSLEDRGLLARRAAAIASEIAFCTGIPTRQSLAGATEIEEESTSFVRYTELHGRSRLLVARPVDVSGVIDNTLRAPASIFVSATLRVGNAFTHFRNRLGLEDAEELAVGSPFDYAANAALYLPNDLPEPDDPAFVQRACDRVAVLIEASGGGAFVLCTSHRMLQSLRSTLKFPVLTQGQAPKQQLIDRFREHGNTVLLGTSTFWSGVDVAGRALRLVIIDKLPFASPSDPIVAARVARIKAKGQDPFRTYQLPQAALQLRQGFGRLIRRTDDRGMVAILDRRITQRSYGKTFLDSLPACQRLSALEDATRYLALL